MSQDLLFQILVGAFVGAAAGYLGSFMVVKRMSLVGDAMSHVALPGIAVALSFGLSPMLGASIALVLAVVGVWYLQETSEIYPEALVGVFFTGSLALGILITPEAELLEALFGDIERITRLEGIIAIIFSVFILIIATVISKKLILGVISEELAKSTGVAISKINLVYLLLVGAIVALGVKFVGTLLMGALVIVPAASAKNISRGLIGYYLLSVLFGVLSAVTGVIVARNFNIATGPAVVLVSIFIFVLTYLFKTKSNEKTLVDIFSKKR